MTADNQPSNDRPIELTFDYRAEYLRIQVTARGATSAAERADQCVASADQSLKQARLEGDPHSIVDRERITTQVRQQATGARRCAQQAEVIAKSFAADPPAIDSLEARAQTRVAFQEVLNMLRQAKLHQDEASRLSGLRFASP